MSLKGFGICFKGSYIFEHNQTQTYRGLDFLIKNLYLH